VGELYTYLPPTEINLKRLRTVPGSHETSNYGFSIGRGVWTFDSGRWISLAIRVRLNDVGTQNGTSNCCIRYIETQMLSFIRGDRDIYRWPISFAC
jgi:hypothetical protein